jgi:hypothetical protein
MTWTLKTLPYRSLAALAVLSLGLVVAAPPKAESIAPLGYSWSCSSQNCSFTVTTSNHGGYLWNFGDGTITGVSSSTSAFHHYSTPNDNQFHYANVNLAGFATAGGGSPDNITGCQIVYAASAVGIGTSGSCGP